MPAPTAGRDAGTAAGALAAEFELATAAGATVLETNAAFTGAITRAISDPVSGPRR